MEGANGKAFTTDQYALVAHGSAEKPWPFSACSDSRFTPEEFDRLTATLKKENLRLPSLKYLNGRLHAINGLLNMQWTEEQISAKINKQRSMERKYDPANIARTKRESVNKRRIEAEQADDVDEVLKCDAELAALENNSANGSLNGRGAAKTIPTKKSGALANQEKLAHINAKNRGKNAEEVRKALLEEKRKLQLAREQALVDARAKAAAKEKAEAEARLLAIPKGDLNDLFGEGSDISRAATPLGGTPRRSRAGTPVNGFKKDKGLLGAIKKKALDDEAIASLDLEIDVEI